MDASQFRRIGFLGLGSMGRPMVATLLNSGFRVAAYDVRPEARQAVVTLGAEDTASPAAAARGSDALIVMVQNYQQARAALWGPDGGLEALPRGALLVLMSTVAPAQARELGAACAERGVRMLDAPVSGGPQGAAEGRLSIMVGGPAEVMAAARPLLDALGDPSRIWHVGPEPGDGQKMKMINQLLVAVNLVAVSEALTLAAKAGLDVRQAFDVVRQSAGGSWILNERGPRMLAGEFTPPRSYLDILLKDIGIVVDTADEIGHPVLLAAVARQVYKMAAALGFNTQDDSAIVRVYETLAGVQIGPRG